MPFNNSKNGFENETAFIKKLNNRKFQTIDYNLQLFLQDIFDVINKNSKVECYKNDEPQNMIFL